ncbi:cytochrome C [Paenibacillus flagellatus]|uniref:Cytochrome C n=2 Tax=Paenibacillus flagellatus TaxID=2211139 RepID=A0A2V5K1V2_9BACL|nr:cytochrome C [Paenibacillus flagellatus]
MEAPKIETPKTEPNAEAPQAGTPKTETPKPAATPSANAPSAPSGATAQTESPKAGAPQTEPPKTEAPKPTEPAKTEPAKEQPSADTTATAKAEELFKGNCMACHGGSLEGKSGPNLQKVGGTLTKEQIMTQIAKGGSKMPGFEKKLDAEAIETLAGWLAAKK